MFAECMLEEQLAVRFTIWVVSLNKGPLSRFSQRKADIPDPTTFQSIGRRL